HLKDIASNVLFFAGQPETLGIDAPVILRSASGNYKFLYRDPGTIAYQAYSTLERLNGINDIDSESFLTDENRLVYLRLPRIDERIAALARTVTASQTSELGEARTLES